jgi:hypothetical protein
MSEIVEKKVRKTPKQYVHRNFRYKVTFYSDDGPTNETREYHTLNLLADELGKNRRTCSRWLAIFSMSIKTT